MHIDGWHVDGFGVFSGYDRRGLSEGLTVFLGPNEAGKSTLLAFLRWVLVGYPSRGAGDNYPPLHGGEHGGRVFLMGAEGETAVERMVRSRTPRVIFSDRVEQGDEAVRRLLGGVDAGLFNSVFAFSLTELQDLKSLTGEGVRDRIFSAGIAGAGRSARQVVARLDKEAGDLLRPRKGGTINTLIERLAEAESVASEARAAAAGYPALLLAEEEAAARVNGAEDREETLRKALERYRLLLELWPEQVELDDALHELARLGPIDDVPIDSELRLRDTLSTLDAASRAATDLQMELEGGSKNVETASASLRAELMALSPRVDRAVDSSGVYDDRLAAMPEAQAALLRAEERLARAHIDLGPDWDEHRIRTFDLSLARQEEVREWGLRLAESVRVVEEAGRAYESALDRAEEYEAERDRMRERLEAVEAPEEFLLRAREAALRRLRTGLHEAHGYVVENAGLHASVADREHALHTARDAGAAASPARGGTEAVAWGMAAAALISLAAAVVLGATVDPSWGLALGMTAAILGAAAFLWSRATSRATSGEESAVEISRLEAALDTARSNLEVLEERTRELEGRIAAAAALLDLAPQPTWEEVEQREALILDARESLRTRREAEGRLAEMEDELARARAAAERRSASLEEVRASERRLRSDWAEWKSGLGITAHFGGEGAGEFLQTVAEAKKSLESRDDMQGRCRRLRADADAWESTARALLAEAGREAEVPPGAALVSAARDLQELCRADRTTRDRLALLEEGLRSIELRLEAAHSAVAAAERERDAIISEAGVADEEAFHERLALARRRHDLEERAAQARKALETRLGKGPSAAGSRAELAEGRVDLWEREAERSAAALEGAREEKIEAIRQHRDAERSRQQLEESSDVATLELGAAGIREELQSALRRWEVVTTAKVLIEDTLADYSRTRQPPVLMEASAGFSQVTSGAYTQIMEREDAEGFVVVDDCGGLKRPEELSRGTLEQLYLSLRFGLAREFSRRATAVPVIMDDVLVNFDPRRARATAEVLASFSTEHQVLFFTCHPATADLLREVHPAANVVELGGEAPTQPTLPGV